MMRSPNYYAAPGFERAGLRRREPEWIRARVLDPASAFVPVWRNQNLVIEVEGGEPLAAVLTVDAVGPLYGSLSDDDVEERLARGEFVVLGLLSAHRPGGHHAGDRWRPRFVGPQQELPGSRHVFDVGRVCRARRKPRRRGRPRGARGNRNRGRRGPLPLVAALAVPGQHHARVLR